MYKQRHCLVMLSLFIQALCLFSVAANTIQYDNSAVLPSEETHKDNQTIIQELVSLVPTQTEKTPALYASVSSYLSNLFAPLTKKQAVEECSAISHYLLSKMYFAPQEEIKNEFQNEQLSQGSNSTYHLSEESLIKIYKSIARYEFENLRTPPPSEPKKEKSEAELQDERYMRYIKYAIAGMIMYQISNSMSATERIASAERMANAERREAAAVRDAIARREATALRELAERREREDRIAAMERMTLATQGTILTGANQARIERLNANARAATTHATDVGALADATERQLAEAENARIVQQNELTARLPNGDAGGGNGGIVDAARNAVKNLADNTQGNVGRTVANAIIPGAGTAIRVVETCKENCCCCF